MILFLDSSALVKFYSAEQRRELVFSAISTVLSVSIDKKTTFFHHFQLQPLFVSARIARVFVEKQVSQQIRKLL